MSCRLHYTEQIRQDILNKYGVGKTSAQLVKPNIILLPIGGIDNSQNKLQSIKNTNEWALRGKKEIDVKYHAKYYGSQIVIDNNSNPRGTLVRIEIKSKLIDDFEKRDNPVKPPVNTPVFYQLDNNKVDYKLKAIKALQSDKVRNPKNNLQGFYNDLQKQGVPNQQIEIIKSLNPENKTKEELLTELLANYSYTIEINTAEDSSKLIGWENNPNTTYFEFTVDNIRYTDSTYGYYYKRLPNTSKNVEISEEEYNKARIKSSKNPEAKPTQYYSNLTVPGGTNYTEQEIATPLITPSIKGHAQFATDNGIGWFRSDDYRSTKEADDIFDEGVYTKTRRILEVQSDLFQKGRDKESLTTKIELLENSEFNASAPDWMDYDLLDKKPFIEKDVKGNQFLQLLNKDNNWVTFFVKSIIQDSAKKGYEKVLFPTGETASKVEGHETLEEFKKQKENRIKELENLKSTDKYRTNWKAGENHFGKILTEQDANNLNYYNKEVIPDEIDNEIKTLNGELERVEKEGFGALRPIYNFYENTVTNILKKNGYSPKVITDEYGNTWNEITINNSRDISGIFLQVKNDKQSNTNDNEILKEQVNTLFKEYLQQNGIKIEFLDSLKQEYSNDPVAIYDSINKVIKINLNKADITTLPEELGHHISIALGLENTLVKRALNLIGRLDYKNLLGQEYVELYRNDATLLKLEYLGKLISKRIVDNNLPDELKSENGIKIWDTIKNILNAFIKLFKPFIKLFKPNSNIQRTIKVDELDKIVSELSGKILNGEAIEEGNILPVEMAQLDKKFSEIDKKYAKQIHYFTKLLTKLKNSEKSLSKQYNSETDEVKKNNLYSTLEYNKTKIKNIESNLAELVETKNKQILINLSEDTLNEIETYINKVRNNEKLPNGESLANIVVTLRNFQAFTPTATQASKILDEIKPIIRQYTIEQGQSNLDRDISGELDENEQDLFAGAKNFGTLTDIKNSIGKTIGFIIKKAQNIISTNNKKSYEIVKEHVDKLTKWAKANGVKNMYDIFIQEHNGTTVLTKEFTSEFYKQISDSYKLPDKEGIAARKKIAVFDENRPVGDRFVPIDRAKYSNKNYVKIQNTKELKEFYEFYKKQIKDLSDRLPVNLNENFIPNIAEKTIGDILKSDKKWTSKLKEGIGHVLDVYESNTNDFIIDNELVDENTIKLKYIHKIGAEHKSKDLGTSLLKFMYFTNSYEQMDDVLPKVRLLQEQIAEKKNFIKDSRTKQTISGEDSNVYKMVDAFIKMQVLGQMKEDEKYAPAIDFGLKYTSLLRIGLNPFNALTNVIIGNIGNFVEGAGGRFFNNTEYTKAVALFTQYNAIDMSTKDEANKSKLHKLILLFNPLMELEDYENLEKINIGSNEYRDKINSLMYAPQRIGEKQLQTSTMLATMLHTKLKTKDGVEINMLDAFDENGKWKSDLIGYELTNEEITKFSNKIHKINQMIHGRYSSKDAAILQQYALFRAAFQFKKWIPAAIESRFQSKRFDDALGVEIEGRYHTYSKSIKLLIAKIQGDIDKIEKYKFTETDIYNMRKNMMELTITLATIGMYVGLGWDDDKEKKKSGWYKFTMSQLDRVSGDLLQWYNPSKMIESGSGGVPMLKTAKDLLNVIPNMQYIVGGEKSEYKKGRKKGENKFVSSFVDVLPVIKPIKDLVRTWNDEPYEAPRKQ